MENCILVDVKMGFTLDLAPMIMVEEMLYQYYSKVLFHINLINCIRVVLDQKILKNYQNKTKMTFNKIESTFYANTVILI